ncbi:MAG: hypothetical protein HYU71_05745 [Bacteroidetes bacterium]|nr:hypothetical protein [Bacteroidota bacterium]
MKQMIVSLLLVAAGLPLGTTAQSVTEFRKGTVQKADQEMLDGTIRDQTAKKGNILFQSSTGKKTVYSPAEIAGFTLNGSNYISYASDFYKVLVAPGKAGLYQRVTDNSGKMLYNGAEVISVTTAEGKAGDYYIQLQADGKWVRITQKDFEATVSSLFAGCSVVVDAVKNKQSDFASLSRLVEQYNTCK